jgi:hypothetical protein
MPRSSVVVSQSGTGTEQSNMIENSRQNSVGSLKQSRMSLSIDSMYRMIHRSHQMTGRERPRLAGIHTEPTLTLESFLETVSRTW